MDAYRSKRTWLAALREATDAVDAALATHAAAAVRAEGAGVRAGLIAAEARPGGALRLPYWRPRFATRTGTAAIGDKAVRERLEELRRTTANASRARNAQRQAIREAAAMGIELDVVASHAQLPLAELERVTRRIPVT
jgi:hypothetical protein